MWYKLFSTFEEQSDVRLRDFFFKGTALVLFLAKDVQRS